MVASSSDASRRGDALQLGSTLSLKGFAILRSVKTLVLLTMGYYESHLRWFKYKAIAHVWGMMSPTFTELIPGYLTYHIR